MSRFRAFPYRGSLLRSQTGNVQEVSHPSQPLCTAGTSCLAADQLTCHSQRISQNGIQPQANHIQELADVLPVHDWHSTSVA